MGNSHCIDGCGNRLRRSRCDLTPKYTSTGHPTDIHSNGTVGSDTAPGGYTFAHRGSNTNTQAQVHSNACATTDSLT